MHRDVKEMWDLNYLLTRLAARSSLLERYADNTAEGSSSGAIEMEVAVE